MNKKKTINSRKRDQQNNLWFFLSVLICLPLQERGEQQANKDLPPRWEVRLLWASYLPDCSRAHPSLPPRVSGPVQRQTGHKASVPCFQIPTGCWCSLFFVESPNWHHKLYIVTFNYKINPSTSILCFIVLFINVVFFCSYRHFARLSWWRRTV